VPSFDVPLGRLMRVAPGLPSADMARTVAHYQRLGFHFSLRDGEFAIAEREGVQLHFAVKADHDPARTATWVHVTVDDADVLAAEFRASGFAPRTEPHDTDHRMREFAHIDPDGNLLLFGSRQGTSAQQEFDQRVFEFATAINRGDVERVREFLAQDRTLATSLINSRWPLHLFADAPGHRPNAVAMVAALVEAGAELDAQAVDMWHEETALHWAASNDDVELIDALLDAGADIEHPGSSIGGAAQVVRTRRKADSGTGGSARVASVGTGACRVQCGGSVGRVLECLSGWATAGRPAPDRTRGRRQLGGTVVG
jgi:hypothetical protein